MKLQFSIFLFAICSLVFSQEQDKFIGKWKDQNENIIEIYKSEGKYFEYNGRIVSSEMKQTQNVNLILISMRKANSLKLYGGTFFDEEKGTEYECVIKLRNDNKLKIRVLKSFFISKKYFWSRISN